MFLRPATLAALGAGIVLGGLLLSAAADKPSDKPSDKAPARPDKPRDAVTDALAHRELPGDRPEQNEEPARPVRRTRWSSSTSSWA